MGEKPRKRVPLKEKKPIPLARGFVLGEKPRKESSARIICRGLVKPGGDRRRGRRLKEK